MFLKRQQNNFINFLKKPFPLLDVPRDRMFLIVFCGLFATFFLVFYQPLNLGRWNYDSKIGNFLTIWSAGLVGASILAITQLVLRPRFKLNTFKIGQFIAWVGFEFFLLSIIFYFLYGESKFPFWQEYFSVLQHTISLTFIPYFFACLLIAVLQLSRRVNTKKIGTVISPPIEQHIFKDENGKIVLVIKPQQLLFVKSENNYTSIYFLKNDKVEKQLIRTTLKNLEQELSAFPNLLRIHRSYMVNLKNINSLQRIKGSFQIEMTNLPEMPLKVSESYKARFAAHLEKN